MQSQAPSDITSDDKLWVLLAYIFSPLVPVIILLMADKKDRPFIKANNIQALIWGICWVVSGIFDSHCIPGLRGWHCLPGHHPSSGPSKPTRVNT